MHEKAIHLPRSTPAVVGAVVALFFAGPRASADGEAVAGFPNWAERVELEWTNRARSEPSVEMTKCGSACADAANNCYTPMPPLVYEIGLNHSARFHSDEMAKQAYFAHDSQCMLQPNIATLYPSACDGSASCACASTPMTCVYSPQPPAVPTCSSWNDRIKLFIPLTGAWGEIIASSNDPNTAFYQWLFEKFPTATCADSFGNPTNGHRWNLLKSTGRVGFGVTGSSSGDFDGGGVIPKIPSGSHYPRQAASVDVWVNWYDAAAPKQALVNVDGTCRSLTRGRGADTNGAWTAAVSGVGSGCHRYYFSFVDSSGTQVTYPTTGSLGIGPQASCADFDTARPASGAGCVCTPSCAGKTCGDNGCGGSCGTCVAADTCQAGACVPTGVADASTSDTRPPLDTGSVSPDSAGSPDTSSLMADTLSGVDVLGLDSEQPFEPGTAPDSALASGGDGGPPSQQDGSAGGNDGGGPVVAAPSSGCACTLPSQPNDAPAWALCALGIGVAALSRRRRDRV